MIWLLNHDLATHLVVLLFLAIRDLLLLSSCLRLLGKLEALRRTVLEDQNLLLICLTKIYSYIEAWGKLLSLIGHYCSFLVSSPLIPVYTTLFYAYFVAIT